MNKVRTDFPILETIVHGKPLVYLDNAATTQKPVQVIDCVANFYRQYNANVHRGLHYLSACATEQYDAARVTVQQFLNANSSDECVFVRGATEAINLVANSYRNLTPDDEIIISVMEHHSNIVPWQIICEQTGAQLKVIPVTDAGELDMAAFKEMVSERTKLVSIVHVSNAIGTINPVKDIIKIAHQHGARVLLDGAQAAPHMKIDVQDLDVDMYVFSGHKMYGPTGIGVLYAKRSILESMAPYQSGGDMILEVSFEKTIYNKIPYKFEAGTPNIAGAIGLATAIDYLTAIGLDKIAAHEHMLLEYATEKMRALDGINVIGSAQNKVAVISFEVENCHPHDVATILDHDGVAIRAGHHCAMPLIERFNLPATNRISMGLYNTTQEIDAFIIALNKVREMMVV